MAPLGWESGLNAEDALAVEEQQDDGSDSGDTEPDFTGELSDEDFFDATYGIVKNSEDFVAFTSFLENADALLHKGWAPTKIKASACSLYMYRNGTGYFPVEKAVHSEMRVFTMLGGGWELSVEVMHVGCMVWLFLVTCIVGAAPGGVNRVQILLENFKHWRQAQSVIPEGVRPGSPLMQEILAKGVQERYDGYRAAVLSFYDWIVVSRKYYVVKRKVIHGDDCCNAL